MTSSLGNRGVSEVVGAILVFGIIVAALGTHQAFIVPDQNSEVEFKHEQVVQDDLLDARNSLLASSASGEITYSTVKLGETLPQRILALNPPDPTGELETFDGGNILINGTAPEVLNLSNETEHQTNFLNFEASYREYQSHAPIRYEHTLLYQDYGDNIVQRSSQQLVQGTRVLLVPLVHEYYEEGVEETSIEFYPGFYQTDFIEDPNITIPTMLSAEQWRTILEDQFTENRPGLRNVTSGESDSVSLQFNGTITIVGAPVGVGDYPATGPRSDDQVPDDDDGPGGGLNPSDPIRLVNITDVDSPPGGSSEYYLDLEFDNLAETQVVFEEARFTLQLQGHSNNEGPADEIDEIYYDGENIIDECELIRGGQYCTFTQPVVFGPTQTGVTLTVSNTGVGSSSHQRVSVLEFITGDGNRLQYMFTNP